MKKMYGLLTALLLVSSPMLALRLYVKNKTKKTLHVWVPDDGKRGNFLNAREIEHNKTRNFTTTLTKKIRGPLYFVVDEDLQNNKDWYWRYSTPAGAYFFPSAAVNRYLEIEQTKKRDGYKIRKVPEPTWRLTGKKGKFLIMERKKFRKSDNTEIDPWSERR